MEQPRSKQKIEADEADVQVSVKNEIQEALEGYVLDPKLYPDNAAGLKTAADGRFVLIPQPSSLAEDPLNWSAGKKWATMAIITYVAFLADYIGGSTIGVVIPQSIDWNLTQERAQRAVVGSIFTIGACGLVFVAMANYFGRLPTTLLFQAISFATCAWAAAATNFDSYLAARIVNGFFCSVGQGGALMWVKDLFFFHEHPRVINYVELGVVVSPYFGPLITAFINSGTTWRWAFWVCTILAGIAFLLVFFVDETLYDRSIPATERASRGSRLERLTGVAQWRSRHQRSLAQSLARPVIAITKLPVFLTCVYYFLNFAFVIGVNATVSIWLTNFYGFGQKGIGFFYFFGIIGPLLGWFIGHWMHDVFGKFYARRHQGVMDPEARLLIAYPATIVLFIALLLLGYALERRWHYMVLAVLCAIQTVAVMIVTTAVNAYLLDAYPEGSGEVGAWVTASRNWSGFMSTYIQIEWVDRSGPIKALGTQAGITVASMTILVVLNLYGKQLRRLQGRMLFGRANAPKQY